jgi:molybdopterin-binding protein
MPALPLLKPREAAAMLGISYPTVKQWILSGKLPTVQTPGGHHRIAHAALKPFLNKDAGKPAQDRERYRKVSGRNQLVGRVVDVQIDGLLAKVVLRLADDQQITAIITSDAAREMALKKGDEAAALMKATEVMIERV